MPERAAARLRAETLPSRLQAGLHLADEAFPIRLTQFGCKRLFREIRVNGPHPVPYGTEIANCTVPKPGFSEFDHLFMYVEMFFEPNYFWESRLGWEDDLQDLQQ